MGQYNSRHVIKHVTLHFNLSLIISSKLMSFRFDKIKNALSTSFKINTEVLLRYYHS